MSDDSLKVIEGRIRLLVHNVIPDRFPTLAFSVGMSEDGTQVDIRAGGVIVAKFCAEDAGKSDGALRDMISRGLDQLGTGHPPRLRVPKMTI